MHASGSDRQELKTIEEELASAKTEAANLQRAVEVVNKKLRQSEEKRLEVFFRHEKAKFRPKRDWEPPREKLHLSSAT